MPETASKLETCNPGCQGGIEGTRDRGWADTFGSDYCSPHELGYNPAAVMSAIESTEFSQYAADTTKALTKVMVLHPVAPAITFIAFLLSQRHVVRPFEIGSPSPTAVPKCIPSIPPPHQPKYQLLPDKPE